MKKTWRRNIRRNDTLKSDIQPDGLDSVTMNKGVKQRNCIRLSVVLCSVVLLKVVAPKYYNASVSQVTEQYLCLKISIVVKTFFI